MSSIYGTMSADKTISVQDFIALQSSDDITYSNYSISDYINGYEIFITNILYDYDDELESLAVTIKLTDKERAKYKFKPYLLAYDIYGSTEAKFIIMMMNKIVDPKEFDFEKIKVIRKSDLQDILGRISSVNDEYLGIVHSRLNNKIKSGDGNNIWTE